MSLRLLSGRISIRPDEPAEQTEGGIVLVTADKVTTGTIVGVGPGKEDEDGDITPVSVPVGARVSFLTTNATEVDVLEEKLLILTEDDILAII